MGSLHLYHGLTTLTGVVAKPPLLVRVMAPSSLMNRCSSKRRKLANPVIAHPSAGTVGVMNIIFTWSIPKLMELVLIHSAVVGKAAPVVAGDFQDRRDLGCGRGLLVGILTVFVFAGKT